MADWNLNQLGDRLLRISLPEFRTRPSPQVTGAKDVNGWDADASNPIEGR